MDINIPKAKIDIRTWQVINTTTWQVTDHLRIKNIVSYAEFRERDAFSLYGDNSSSRPVPPASDSFLAPGSPISSRIRNRVGTTPPSLPLRKSSFRAI